MQALGHLAEEEDDQAVISFLNKLDRDKTLEAFPPNFLGEGMEHEDDAAPSGSSFKGSMEKRRGEQSFKGAAKHDRAENKRVMGLPPAPEGGQAGAFGFLRHRQVSSGYGKHASASSGKVVHSIGSPRSTFDSGDNSPTGRASVAASSESRWGGGSNGDAWRRQAESEQRKQVMFSRPSEAGKSLDGRRAQLWDESADVMSEPSARGYRVWLGGGRKDKFDPRRWDQGAQR